MDAVIHEDTLVQTPKMDSKHLVFYVRFGPSDGQIEKGSMVGLYSWYLGTPDEEREAATVGL